MPYLMSSHPGSTMRDAVYLAQCLKRDHYSPEQVQDFYPTPGTASTVMYYTGINPLTGTKVFRTTDYHEKQQQRALLQFNRPQNFDRVREALRACGREDLIGTAPECLVPPERPTGGQNRRPEQGGRGHGGDRKDYSRNGKNGHSDRGGKDSRDRRNAAPPYGKNAPRGAQKGASKSAPKNARTAAPRGKKH